MAGLSGVVRVAGTGVGCVGCVCVWGGGGWWGGGVVGSPGYTCPRELQVPSGPYVIHPISDCHPVIPSQVCEDLPKQRPPPALQAPRQTH